MPPNQATAQPNQNQKKILIIEDETFIAELYSNQLTKAGFTVKMASEGQTGLKILAEEQFDLLLLDILLPDINGLELLKQIKSKSLSPALVILLLTNLGQDDIIKEAFDLGAHGYLIKAALTPYQVVDEVKSALNTKPPQTLIKNTT